MGDINRQLLAQSVINLRTLKSCAPEWAALQRGTLTALSRDKAVDTEFYRGLSDFEQAWLRALAVGRGAHQSVLTGLSAARIHDMWVVGHSRDLVELGNRSAPPRAQWNPGTVYRRLALTDDDIITAYGVRTPRLFRIFAEIARHHGFRDGLVAADWLRAHGMSKSDMMSRADELGRLPGIGTVRDAIEHSVPNSDSPYEPYARAILLEAGLGPIETQVQVAPGVFVDMVVAGVAAVEIDGDSKYSGQFGPTEQVLIDERKREKHIHNLGIPLTRHFPKELHTEENRFIAEVTDAVSRGRAVFGGGDMFVGTDFFTGPDSFTGRAAGWP